MSTDFVHLHVHTCFSLLDGACRIKDLMARTREQGMRAVAMTDHGVMYGAIDFYRQAKKADITPILGVEAYMARGSCRDKTTPAGQEKPFHVVLLASDGRGYHNMARLMSLAQIEGHYHRPRIDRDLLQAHHEGLIALSGCIEGEVAERILAGDENGAVAAAGRMAEIMGRENYFLEVQDNGMPEQRKACAGMVSVARRTGLPLVATNDVHYLKREHAEAHEVMLCMQTQTHLSDPKRLRLPTHEFYLKSPAEMAALFREIPEALRATVEIARRCDVDLKLHEMHFPAFRIPEGFDQRGYLDHLCTEGLKRRCGIANPDKPAGAREQEYVKRYRYELGVIETTRYINYYLVVWDFVTFARRSGIPVGLRGSGGASLIAYLIGISDIDPLRYALVFERFLNPQRVEPPDFDIDFCQDRRGEVIEYVRGKYGPRNVAQIITFGSLGAKTVIRDVGRALEVSYADCDRFAKMVPDDLKITLPEALKKSQELKQAYDTDANCRRILDYAFVLEGLYRNAGVHAAGVVIGEKPLIEIIPLTRGKDNEVVTQYTMDDIKEVGLLKMDLLGLRTLTVIQETVNLVREFRGKPIDLDTLPLDDGPTYALFNRGDTVGVFQLESGGMRDLIRRVGIGTIEDLIAMIALYRPSSMDNLDPYVDRKSGKTRVTYDHPLLEDVLRETYGVMIYQEQVQRAANVLAGFTLGEGDILRRAISKKDERAMEAMKAKFIEGCRKHHQIHAQKAEAIYDGIAKFAGYGFNKSHSTAYAVVAYRTAYLKANFPREFLCALLSSEMDSTDKLPVFVREAREMGLDVLPPDINESGVRFRPSERSDKSIRFGLAGVKNVGLAAVKSVVDERTRGGPFKGFLDFCKRIDSQTLNRKVLESLVKCGAFDSLGMPRARLFAGIDFAAARAAAHQRDRASGQRVLFDVIGPGAAEDRDEDLPQSDPWPESEMLAAEKELLGMYVSGHPLSEHAALLERYQLTNVEGLASLQDRTVTRIGGLVSEVSKRIAKNTGEAWAVVRLEDLDGAVEVMVFANAYREYGQHLQQGAAILVCGEVRREDPIRMFAQEIHPLRDAPRLFAHRVGIHLPSAAAQNGGLDRIKAILRLHPGKTPVVLCVEFPGGEKVFIEAENALCVTPDEGMVSELEQCVGEGRVYVAVNQRPCRTAGRSQRAQPSRQTAAAS